MDFETHLDGMLRTAEANGLLRSPIGYETQGTRVSDGVQTLISFASNDYLGLAHHPALRAALAEGATALAGGGSSRIVAGTSPAHRAAEDALARHVALADARLFSSAYAANLAILGLLGDGDLVLSDALNHASIVDGCRSSRAHHVIYRHGDLDHLAQLLRQHRPSARVAAIVSETAFSMDGDLADIAGLRRLADEHDAALIVDEAHALGVLGPRGAGLCAEAGVTPEVLVGGLGKSFGLAGGFVAGSLSLGRAVDNFARTFVFSTAILPAIAHAVPTAVELLRAADRGRALVQGHASTLRLASRRAHGRAPAAIVPVLVGAPAEVVGVARQLRTRGFLVPAMRPPTVPANTARLRITPTAAHTVAEVDALAEALRAVVP